MADPNTTPTDTAPAAEPTAPATTEATPVETAVPADSSSVIHVDTTPVAAQVPGPPAPAATTVPVHEVRVATDRAILDTSSPLAVQVPPRDPKAGLTPIALAFENPRSQQDAIDEAEKAEAKS